MLLRWCTFDFFCIKAPRGINLLDKNKIKLSGKWKACDSILATFLDHIRHHSHWSRGAGSWRWFTRQRTSTFVHLTIERHCDLTAALVHWWLFDFVCLALFYMFTSIRPKTCQAPLKFWNNFFFWENPGVVCFMSYNCLVIISQSHGD